MCKKLKNCYAKISKIHHLNAKINRWSKKFKQWPVVEDTDVSHTFLRVNHSCTKSLKKLGHRVDHSCTKSLKKLGHRVNHSCTKSLKKWDIAKSQTAKLRKIAHFITSLRKVRHCEKSNSKIAKNCTLYYKSQKSETSRKVKTAKIAKKFTIHYTAVIFQKSTVTQSLRNRGGNITESHTESQYKLEKALRGSKIQKSAIEPLRKMR